MLFYILAVAVLAQPSPTEPASSGLPTHPTGRLAEQARSETFRLHAEGVEDSIRDLVARDLALAEARDRRVSRGPGPPALHIPPPPNPHGNVKVFPTFRGRVRD